MIFQVIQQLCTVFRYLILDDDIRIEFGKAHEHAKLIATDCLIELTQLIDSKPVFAYYLNKIKSFVFIEFADKPGLVGDLILTVASLTVRNEYCVLVEEAGGLTFILTALVR